MAEGGPGPPAATRRGNMFTTRSLAPYSTHTPTPPTMMATSTCPNVVLEFATRD